MAIYLTRNPYKILNWWLISDSQNSFKWYKYYRKAFLGTVQFQFSFDFSYILGHFFTTKVITNTKHEWFSRHTLTDLRKTLLKSCLLFQISVTKDISLSYKPWSKCWKYYYQQYSSIQIRRAEACSHLVRNQTDLLLPETFGHLYPGCATGAPFCNSRNHEQLLDTLHSRMKAKASGQRDCQASGPWLGCSSLHTGACEPHSALSCCP